MKEETAAEKWDRGKTLMLESLYKLNSIVASPFDGLGKTFSSEKESLFKVKLPVSHTTKLSIFGPERMIRLLMR